MVYGQLRVAVIGTQTLDTDTSHPYTVYLTVVNYHGECYERVLRYREIRKFAQSIKTHSGNTISAPFPPKSWTRKQALKTEVVEARQVLLNEFMREVCEKKLTMKSEDKLLRLLRVGKYEDLDTGKPSMRERPTMDVAHEQDDQPAAPTTSAVTMTTASTLNPSSSSSMTDTDELWTVEEQAEEEEEEGAAAEAQAKERVAPSTATPTTNPSHSDSGPITDHNVPVPIVLQRSASSPAQPLSHTMRSSLEKSASFPASPSKSEKMEFAEREAGDGGIKQAAVITQVDGGELGNDESEGLSPEKKYQHQIAKRLSNIKELLSDSNESRMAAFV